MPVVPKRQALFLRVVRTCVFVIGVTGAYAGGILHSADTTRSAHHQMPYGMQRAEGAALTYLEPRVTWSMGSSLDPRSGRSVL